MKTAIVTGATSGIGRAAAIALADDGYWVLATGRDEQRGEEVQQRIGERGKGAFLGEDLDEEGAPERIVEHAVSETGRLDVLVNNAGIHFLATIEETDPGRLDELMAVNLRAAMLLSRAAIPAMRDSGGGVIVNVSSEAGVVAVPNQVAYNVSKAAMLMLTKSIAVDHADDGIRAVSICPGTTRTPLVEAAIRSAKDPEEHEKWLASSRPAKRLGAEEEMARTIVFVAGDAVPYMTGSEIVIDGGYTAV
jgi:NAD(P)-dependent dehydrogenase (short-subunit alcohol dehydrogenase family)